jgi:hypothetical protein
VGGPFTPASAAFTLENVGTGSIDFAVAAGAEWLQIAPASGTLAPGGAPVQVTASLSAAAGLLSAGTHVSAITFANLTNGAGDTSRAVTLVAAPKAATNDDFANATVLPVTSGSTAGSNVHAGKEAGEPNHAGKAGGASVWWRWQAPTTGILTVDTIGSTFDTLLAAYTGASPPSLVEIASNDDGDEGLAPQSRISLETVAGQHYHLAVDGAAAATGSIRLTWSFLATSVSPSDISISPSTDFETNGPVGGPFGPATSRVYTVENVSTVAQTVTLSGLPAWLDASTTGFELDAGSSQAVTLSLNAVADGLPAGTQLASIAFNDSVRLVRLVVSGDPPPNDAFAAAVPLSGEKITVSGTNVGATKETGEPDHASDVGGRSVWYGWTAPVSRPVEIDTDGSDFDTTLAVYTGAAVDALSEVASNDDRAGDTLASRVRFAAEAGTTYLIAVDGFRGDAGAFTLNVDATIVRVPEDFATIQAAIDAAAEGDTVLVGPGTYLESIDFKGKGVTVVGEAGPAHTVLVPISVNAVSMNSAEGASSVIEGLTIRGRVDLLGTSPTIRGNVFERNGAVNSAGIRGNIASPTVVGNRFRESHDRASPCAIPFFSHEHGVMGFANASSPYIASNVFEGNGCQAIFLGVPVGGAPKVINNTFVDNQYAIVVDRRGDPAAIVVRNNVVVGNGTGLHLQFGSAASNPTWENNLVFGNDIDYSEADLTGINGNLSAAPRIRGSGERGLPLESWLTRDRRRVRGGHADSRSRRP